jgi:solute carrier family 45, member 1/2/4
MGLVWLAGPLAGTFAQPYFGAWSDQSSSGWGRRRPFILLGGVLTIISLLGLAWSQEIVESLSQALHSSPGRAPIATKVVAICFVYLLNLGTQPIQGGLRALIIDKAPRHQQREASAWASRLIEAGNLLSYITGFLHLPGLLPFLGGTQFKILCLLVSFVLAVSLAITSWFIAETAPEQNETFKYRHSIRDSLKCYAFKLPTISKEIKIILQVQFASWMSWFPFLYYTTT